MFKEGVKSPLNVNPIPTAIASHNACCITGNIHLPSFSGAVVMVGGNVVGFCVGDVVGDVLGDTVGTLDGECVLI